MKLIGRLLVVTAMLTTVTAFIGSGPGGAARSSLTYSCDVFLGTDQLIKITTQPSVTTVNLTAPTMVDAGGEVPFNFELEPGLGNGPIAFPPNGITDVTVSFAVSGSATPATVSVNTGPVVVAVPANGVVPVPEVNSSVTAGDVSSGSLSITPSVITFRTVTPTVSNSRCTPVSPSATTVEIATPATSSTSSTSSTSTTSSTSSTSTTSTTAAPTTTAPAGGLEYAEDSVTSFMKCTLKYPSFPAEGVVLPSGTEMTVTVQAPKEATAGKPYTVFMYIEPGLETGIGLDAGAVEGAVTELSVSSPGAPATVVTAFPDLTNPAAIPGGGYVKIPVSEAVVNAAGTVGQSITVTAKSFAIKTGAFGSNSPGSVSCVPDAAPELSTRLVEREFVDTKPPTPPPTQTPTTAPVVPPAPGLSAASAAPVSAEASAGVQAQVIEKSAQVTYKCEIYSGSNLITTQNDTQTVTIKTVDKVAPGGTLSFQMSLAPGPKTGPVALPSGVQNVAVGAAAGGPASPSQMTMSAGNLSAPVGTNSNINIPTVSGSTKATGSDGESITLTAADMRFETARPPSRTECTAQNPPVITTTAIVTGVEVDAATAEQLASTGNGRGWLLPLAIVQLVVGLGLVMVQQGRRRTA